MVFVDIASVARGDAIMMRDMKRRQRLMLGFAALIALLGAVGVLLRPAFVEPHVGGWAAAEINAYLDSVEPEGEAAWPIYHKIIVDNLGVGGSQSRGADAYLALSEYLATIEPSHGDWADKRFDPARDAIDAFSGSIEQLRAAASRGRFGKCYVAGGDALSGEVDLTQIADWPPPSILLPELSPMKRLASLLIFAMRDAAGSAEWEDYARYLRASIGLGEYMLRSGSYIEWSSGQRVIRDALQELRYTLLENDLDPPVVRTLQDSARVHHAGTFASVLECERFLARESLDRVYGTNGFLVTWRWDDHKDGILEGDAFEIDAVRRLGNLRAYLYPRYTDSRSALDVHYDTLVTRARAMESTTWIAAITANPFVEPENEVVQPLASGYRRGWLAYARLTREIAATTLMLEIESRTDETGAPPAVISEVYVPTDPSTGLPFLYETDDTSFTLRAKALPMEEEPIVDLSLPRPRA